MKKLIWKTKVWSGKAVKLLLKSVFGFDRWHVFTLAERQYAKDIINWCNQRPSRQKVAEIGCGMGDILRNLRYQLREGYDSDQRILRAARFMAGITGNRNIRFSVFRFPDSPLPGRYDLLLMVNWIHNVPPSLLKEKIAEYFSGALPAGGCLIVDTVQDPEYQFNHSIGWLTSGLQAEVRRLGAYERQREIWLIIK